MNSVIALLGRPEVFTRVARATVAAAARALASGEPYAFWDNGTLVLLYPDAHCERWGDQYDWHDCGENDDGR